MNSVKPDLFWQCFVGCSYNPVQIYEYVTKLLWSYINILCEENCSTFTTFTATQNGKCNTGIWNYYCQLL